MELSIRMGAVAAMVTPGLTLADIGTDHAYIPVYLVQKGIVPKALAMDVRSGPLQHAQASIEKYGMQGKITTRLSDGLHEMKAGEAESVVIAGMGGLLMIRLLKEGSHVMDTVKEFILQPQSDLCEVRQYLHEAGFRIMQENMVIDNDKYYPMMRVVRASEDAYSIEDDKYGRCLIEAGHPVLEAYLLKEIKAMQGICEGLKKQSSEKSQKRLAELENELQIAGRALDRLRANRRDAS